MGLLENPAFPSVLLVLIVWLVPIALVIWFILTLSSIAKSLRIIADRSDVLERAK